MKYCQVVNKAWRENIRMRHYQKGNAQVSDYSDEDWKVIVWFYQLEARWVTAVLQRLYMRFL